MWDAHLKLKFIHLFRDAKGRIRMSDFVCEKHHTRWLGFGKCPQCTATALPAVELEYQKADNSMHSANFGTHVKEAVAIVKDWAGEQRGESLPDDKDAIIGHFDVWFEKWEAETEGFTSDEMKMCRAAAHDAWIASQGRVGELRETIRQMTELLRDIKHSTFHEAHTKEHEYKYSDGIFIHTCTVCKRLDESGLLKEPA
jgi:hypothetical protein